MTIIESIINLINLGYSDDYIEKVTGYELKYIQETRKAKEVTNNDR